MEYLELQPVGGDDKMMRLIVNGRFFDDVPEDDDWYGENVDLPGEEEEPGPLDDRGAEAAKAGEAENGDEAGDPAKLRRKQRNKEAASRSRQKKKEYVKQLEGKSVYYEWKCRRLGRLLMGVVAEKQAFMAANQELHRRLQNCVCNANVAKQEPAVLSAQNFSLSGGRQVDDSRMVAAAEGGRRREESGRLRETVAGRQRPASGRQ